MSCNSRRAWKWYLVILVIWLATSARLHFISSSQKQIDPSVETIVNHHRVYQHYTYPNATNVLYWVVVDRNIQSLFGEKRPKIYPGNYLLLNAIHDNVSTSTSCSKLLVHMLYPWEQWVPIYHNDSSWFSIIDIPFTHFNSRSSSSNCPQLQRKRI